MSSIESRSWAFLSEAPELRDLPSLEERFREALSAFGFDRYCCTRLSGLRISDTPTVVARYGFDDWDRRYWREAYIEQDPCSDWIGDNRTGFTWIDVREAAPGRAETMWSEARAEGMSNAFVVQMPGPIGEKIVLRMASPSGHFRGEQRPLLESVGVVFATLAARLHELAGDRPGPDILSRRETECLRWAALGKSDWEIGAILDISPKTVNHHVESAKRKLDVPTRIQAVTTAMALGLLGPGIG